MNSSKGSRGSGSFIDLEVEDPTQRKITPRSDGKIGYSSSPKLVQRKKQAAIQDESEDGSSSTEEIDLEQLEMAKAIASSSNPVTRSQQFKEKVKSLMKSKGRESDADSDYDPNQQEEGDDDEQDVFEDDVDEMERENEEVDADEEEDNEEHEENSNDAAIAMETVIKNKEKQIKKIAGGRKVMPLKKPVQRTPTGSRKVASIVAGTKPKLPTKSKSHASGLKPASEKSVNASIAPTGSTTNKVTYGVEKSKGIKRRASGYTEDSEPESVGSQRKRASSAQLPEMSRGCLEDLAPEEAKRYRKIKGVSYHIGKSVFVKTYPYGDTNFIAIRHFDMNTGRAKRTRGINLQIDHLPTLKIAIDKAYEDYISAPQVFFDVNI